MGGPAAMSVELPPRVANTPATTPAAAAAPTIIRIDFIDNPRATGAATVLAADVFCDGCCSLLGRDILLVDRRLGRRAVVTYLDVNLIRSGDAVRLQARGGGASSGVRYSREYLRSVRESSARAGTRQQEQDSGASDRFVVLSGTPMIGSRAVR